MERGNKEKMTGKQMLRARDHSRNDLLVREKPQISKQKLIFNITYYTAFQNVRAIMEELHILLTPNKEHKKAFPNVLLVGIQNDKSLKDFLVRATYPFLMRAEDINQVGNKLV